MFPAYSVKTQVCISVRCSRNAVWCFVTPTELLL